MEPLTALTDWAAFFAAQVGAAAALAGLLFVGISLNLSKILAAPFLPLRGFLALLLLIAILALSSLLLMPGLSRTVAGLGTLGVGALIWIAGSVIEWIGWRHRTPQQHTVTFLSNVVLLAFVKAVADAWVLLVEINR